MTRWDERRVEQEAMRHLELQWSRTWLKRSHDFSAYDRAVLVGRVYRLDVPVGGGWHWTMSATVGDRSGAASGVSDDRDTACLLVERNYRMFRQRIGAK